MAYVLVSGQLLSYVTLCLHLLRNRLWGEDLSVILYIERRNHYRNHLQRYKLISKC